MKKPSIVPRRYPCGKLMGAAERQNKANAMRAEEAQSVVLAQPHRRGNADVLCESPLGRFVLKYALPRELYEAGLLYATTRRMWLGGCWKAPIDEKHSGSGGDISEELSRKMRDDSKQWFIAMKEAGDWDGAMAVQTMADGYDPRADIIVMNAIKALRALGKITGKL